MDGVSSATRNAEVPLAGHRPALVLDNNVLRDESVIERCIARYRETGEQFALPEMAMFELTKHPDAWESTVRRSLGCIARCPEALVITHSAKDLGLTEEGTGRPTKRVESDKATSAWRKLLCDLREGHDPNLDYFRWAVTNLRKELRYEEYETDTLATIQKLRDIARSTFPRELVAKIGEDRRRSRALQDRPSWRAQWRARGRDPTYSTETRHSACPWCRCGSRAPGTPDPSTAP